SKITEGFQKMRGDRGGSDRGRDDGRGRDDRSRGDYNRTNYEEAVTIEPLVPGFDIIMEFESVPGFGAAATLFDQPVNPVDLKEAEDRIRRYDRNKSGFIEKDELSERWSGSPMDYDQNGDGRLSARELSYRYGRMRQEREKNESKRRGDSRRESSRRSEKVEVEGPGSYRIETPQPSESLPAWFTEKDANKNMQVEMSEYSDKWDDATVKEFFDQDVNRDGVITSAECIAVIDGTANRVSRFSSKASTGGGGSSGGNVRVDDRYLKYAKRLVPKYDKNKDGSLQPTEWKRMMSDPSAADVNADGKITINEYGAFLQNRSKR
ncbi:MAG: EF-hand domain-containing protein, partial [Planctomycetota bacterium]